MAVKRNIIIIITGVAIVLLIRLFYLQVLDGSYKITAANNALRYDVEYPARGMIYDRNGNVIVENIITYDIMVTPRELKTVDTAELSKIFRIQETEISDILKKIDRKKSFNAFTFLKQVPADIYAGFRERADHFPGFYSVARTMRVYQRKIGGNVLGYVQEVDTSVIRKNPYYRQGDYIGKSGIEESYEEVLRGKKGVSVYLRNSHGITVEPYEGGRLDSAAIPGRSLTSSIDADLQEYIQEIMINKAGSVVAIEPATGEILALVSSPIFYPEMLSGVGRQQNYARLREDVTNPLYNRAIMSAQPPGSTFKLVNGLIGLQEGTLTVNTSCYCAGRYPYGKGVGCHIHSSPVDFVNSIRVSCNAYYCYAFRNILENKKYPSIDSALMAWRARVQKFGFGRKLGIDMPSERQGIVASKNLYNKYYGVGRWNPLSIISLSIGQGEIGATALQLANMCATVANRGYYYIPHIIKHIDEGVHVDPKYYEKQYCEIDEKYFDYSIEGMYLAVNGGGTAGRAAIHDIKVCGKTGTSENPHGANHSIFVCFAPKENPKIAVAAIVENAGFGGTFAAPIASLAVEKYLKREISRTWEETRMKETDLITNNPAYAKKKFKF
ncbi:MAG: penicillin-binding protein 2 [Prevotellaceae bacterium]|jgi:penicillin-binding protein 2|nr:penicillin-binding protein 2 [Prevotellaceae bacterium]